MVRQIARNPVYRGVFYANRFNTAGMYLNRQRPDALRTPLKKRDPGEWIAVPVPALVPEATWAAAQAMMAQAQAHWNPAAKEPYLLSGLLRCGFCGQTMTGRRQRNWGRLDPQYTCRKNTAGHRHPGCAQRPRVPSRLVDALVWNRVLGWLGNPRLLADLLLPHQDTPSLASELHRIQSDLKRLHRGQQNLLQVLAEGLVDADNIFDRLNRLKRREMTLLAQRSELQQVLVEHAEPRDLSAYHARAEAILQHLAEDSDLTAEDRRAIVRQFISEITVGGSTLTIKAVTVPTPATGSAGRNEDYPDRPLDWQ